MRSSSHYYAQLPTIEHALPGRKEAMPVSKIHSVLNCSVVPPFPSGHEQSLFAMGCFWGAERAFWQLPGVYCTAAGYAGGITPNPTYQEVCSGKTGHTESVLVVFDPKAIQFLDLLKVFWEGHNPTQGMRQGNDQGTQYRSAIYVSNQPQLDLAHSSQKRYQILLNEVNNDLITTEIMMDLPFYYAEEHHQQYLAKNPNGYCGLGGTGVKFTL